MAIIDTLKLALSALEESVDLVRQNYADDWRHGVPTRTTQLAMMKQLVDDHEKAIRDLEKLISLVDDHQRIRYNRGKENIMSTYTLPDLPTPKYTETIRGVPCITVTEHEHLMREYALQAIAQVLGAPVWFHKNWGEYDDIFYRPNDVIPDGSTPLYTTPQPAQATQAEVTDERQAFEACEMMAGSLFKRRADDPEKYWDGNVQDDWELWQARAILALRPAAVPMTDKERELAAIDWSPCVRAAFNAGVKAAERHHGINAQAKKEEV